MRPSLLILAVAFATLILTADSRPAAADPADKKVNDDKQLKKTHVQLQAEVAELRAEVAELKRELRQLSSASQTPKGDDADQFAAGTLWIGVRHYENPGTDPEGQAWMLKITKRHGKEFEGEVGFRTLDGTRAIIAVKGKAPARTAGEVVFTSEKQGLLQQEFSGRVDETGTIEAKFRGTNVLGIGVVGRATLRKS